MARPPSPSPWLRRALWLLLSLPLAVLLVRTLTGRLGANPGETLILETGEWTLRLLLLTLAATPLHRLTGWNGLLRHRRLLGLWTFAYACLHLLSYAWLDQALMVREIIADVLERPFIMAGMAAWALLTALALTSWDGAVRRLGPRRWRALHRLVYLAAGLGLLHFWWKVSRGKELDYTEPAVYAVILAVLLLARLRAHRRRAAAAPRRA